MNIDEDSSSVNSLAMSSESGRRANEVSELIKKDPKKTGKWQCRCLIVTILLFLVLLISVCVALGVVLPMRSPKKCGKFECPPGSKLINRSKLRCKHDGTWSGGYCNDTAWKKDVDDFVNIHGDLSHDDLSEQLAVYLHSNYTDVTWVVLVYDPIEGGTIYSVADNSKDNVHYGINIKGHDFAVSRVVVGSVTKDFDYQYALQDLFKPVCVPYCKESPDCVHIDCPQTTAITMDVLTNYFTVNMLFAVRLGNNVVGVAVRKDSASGVVSSSTSLTDTGPVSWDTRIAIYKYHDCHGVLVLLVAGPHVPS